MEGQEFNSPSSQTDDLQNLYSSFPNQALALLGKDNVWLVQCQDNVTDWDIRSWSWQSGLPVGNTIKMPCPDVTLDVART